MTAPSFDVFMQGGGWAVFAFCAAALTACFYLVNQYRKQPGDMLVFVMRAAVVAVMMPMARHIDWPSQPGFYATVFLTVLFGCSADIRTFNVSASHGGGVVSRVMPVTVVSAFFLWMIVRPAQVTAYMAEPFRAAMIFLSIGLCVYFATRMNRCGVTRSATVRMLPALAAYTLTTVLNKYAMDYGLGAASFGGVVFGYIFLQSVISVFIFGPYVLWRRRASAKPDKTGAVPMTDLRGLLLAVLPALAAACVWLGAMTFKNYAVAYTANPAYQAAIGLSAPVIILLFYKAVGHKETADVRAGLGIVLACLLLTIATTWK
jgi:hypothetical protein